MTQTHTLKIIGRNIQDKHTHYEAHSYIGPAQATIIIRGDIATDFQNKYQQPITQADAFQVTLELGRNDHRVKECQDPFKIGSHLIGSIDSIDSIVYNIK